MTDIKSIYIYIYIHVYLVCLILTYELLHDALTKLVL